MFWKREQFVIAGYSVLIVLFVFQEPCNAKINLRCSNPSSCGTLINIAYPFRLTGDPSNCGDPNYELTCENNQPILNLYSGKYYVKAINYNKSTIRIADVGLQDANCSSLPIYTLNFANFSAHDPFWPSYLSEDVMFLSCKTPTKSDDYVDMSPCHIRNQISPSYRYAVVGDKIALELEDWCTIDLMARTNLKEQIWKLSYMDIHDALVFGFELDWSHIQCAECRGQGYCLYDRATHFIKCSDPCSFNHISSFQCAMVITLQYMFYFFYHAAFPIGLFIAVKTVCGALCVFIFLFYKWRRRHLSMFDSVEEFLQSHNNLMPIRYSYLQIRRMTNDFKDKLGEGGYGSVYKGKLRSGSLVAVKMLGKSSANGQEFINEVATIGRIHHVNVVRLIGFCAEGSRRALVYDFMPSGSLDKYILSRSNNISLSWEKMYDISLGVARGIEYLHQGCDMQILHFDIKPHNILLDENFTPKVSDFGLAKSYPTNDIVVCLTAARGTIGYIAPELFYKNIGGVSYKADVYSFGMLLMEMAGKGRMNNAVTEHSSQSYFPFCVYDQFVDGKESEIEDCTADENKIIKKMAIVALWCIQVNPINRPPMNEVVKMLEGELESLQLPPRLFLYPEERLVKDWSLSTDQSISSIGNATR